MKLLSIKLAEEIVHQTMMRLHHNINVINTDGVILASGDKDRVDSIHEGAIQVAKTGVPLLIEEDFSKEFRNSRRGINLPIRFHEKIIGVIGITGNPNELGEIANLVQLTTEMIVHQVLTESKSEWQRKNGDFILKALINGVPVDSAFNERIRKLPFSLEAPFQLLLIKQLKEGSSSTFSLHLENMTYKRQALFGQIQLNEYYLFLCGHAAKNAAKTVRQLTGLQALAPCRIGAGPKVHELEQLPYAFKGAKTALAFSNTQQPITQFEQVEIFTLFKERKSHEIEQFLTKIDGLSGKLTETLAALFESNLQLNICAGKLGIHRHTLTYRLNKVHELTGYHPQNFEDAFILKLALILRKQL